MSITEYVRRIVMRWRVILATIIVMLGAAAAITFTITPEYTSTARVFVSNSGEIKDLGNAMAAGVYAQQKVLSYASIATSEKMAEEVVDDLGLKETPAEVAERVSTAVEFGTVLVTITVTDESAEQANDIAQSIIDNYNSVINEIDSSDGQAAPVTVATMEAPTLPTSPTSPRITLNLLAALFAGLLLGIAFAVLRDLMDDSVKSEQDLVRTNLASLGSIPRLSGKRRRRAEQQEVISFGDRSATAESFRQLRVNLQFASLDNAPRTIMVTSTEAGEGKSFVSANLASVYASAGMRVVLVDLDLRRPVLADRLGLENAVGVTSVLLGRADINEAIQNVPDSTLHVLASGPLPPNPSDVMSTETMRTLLTDLSAQFDVVLLDTAPAGLFADARQLAPMVDGTVIVSRYKQSRLVNVQSTVRSIEEVSGRVFGVVLNLVKNPPQGDYDTYGYAPGEATPAAAKHAKH